MQHAPTTTEPVRKRALPGMAAWAAAGRRLRIGADADHFRVFYLDAWFWSDGFIMLRASDDLFPLRCTPISPLVLERPEWSAPRDRVIEWSPPTTYLGTLARASTEDHTTRVQARFVELVEASYPGAEWRTSGNNRHSFHVVHNGQLVAVVMPLMPSEGEY